MHFIHFTNDISRTQLQVLSYQGGEGFIFQYSCLVAAKLMVQYGHTVLKDTLGAYL